MAGEPVEVPGAKRQAFVACLALRAGRVVPTDTLVEALWGSDLPAAPRNAVQHHVARLRRALGEDAIRLAADGYALEGAAVDAIEFENLLTAARAALRAGDARGAADTIADALDLWRGPALLGLPQSMMATAEAGRLDSLRLDALEERFEAALALGEHADVVSLVRAALEEAPLAARSPWARAHARVRLGRVLAAAGEADTAEALYREVLEWADAPRPHEARESLFLALAERPGAAARAGLDELRQPERESTAVPVRAETAVTS
jgi:DNA-binding SARP family transcriptional activator